MYSQNKKPIFVIGDDDCNIDLICRTLQTIHLPYEQEYIFNQPELSQKISYLHPRLVILDNFYMSDESDYQYCQTIRRLYPPEQGQLLFLGWHMTETIGNKIRSLGKVDVVSKPYKPKDLAAKIQLCLYVRHN